ADAATSASISTPVRACASTRTSISTQLRSAFARSSTSTPSSGSGWQSGIHSPVRFAACTAAIRAVAKTSPFATVPSAMRASVAGAMRTSARATHARSVTGLSPTRTMRARPRASTCERSAGKARHPLEEVAEDRLALGLVQDLVAQARVDAQCALAVAEAREEAAAPLGGTQRIVGAVQDQHRHRDAGRRGERLRSRAEERGAEAQAHAAQHERIGEIGASDLGVARERLAADRPLDAPAGRPAARRAP